MRVCCVCMFVYVCYVCYVVYALVYVYMLRYSMYVRCDMCECYVMRLRARGMPVCMILR